MPFHRAADDPLAPHQILRRRHLDIIRVAGDHPDGNPHSLDQRGVVRTVKSIRRGPLISRKDHFPPEGLRCLRKPETFPWHRLHDPSRRIHLLDRIPDRNAGAHGAELFRPGDGPFDQLPGHERPDAVVDQDHLMFVAHMHQGVPHRILPLPAAGNNEADPGKAVPFDQIPPDVRDIPFRNDENDFVDERGALKCFEGMDEDGDSGQQTGTVWGSPLPCAFPFPRPG